MDSAKIAPVLERMQAEPSLRLDSPHERANAVLGEIFGALLPMGLNKARDGLVPRSAEYFETSRRALFGMGLDELAESDRAKNGWTNAEPGIYKVSAILQEHPEGPYVLGEVASYADLVLAAAWHCFLLLDPPSLTKLYEYDPAIKTHYEACKQWFQRASY